MDPKGGTSNNSTNLQDILSFQYQTQHFGYHPRTFIDRVYNAFFETIVTSLTQMKQYMSQEYRDVMPPHIIKVQTDILLQNIVKILDKSIDKLEVFLNANVFSIQNHVVFPEDKIHIKEPCTKEDDKLVDAEIEELKQRILQEKARKFFLKKKISEQKDIKKELLYLQNKLKKLLNIANQENVTPETMDFLFSNLNKLMEFHICPL